MSLIVLTVRTMITPVTSRKSCGLIYMKDAAGVVEGIGPSVQTTGADVKTMYQGDIIVGRLAMGVGTLNPACAIELQAG